MVNDKWLYTMPQTTITHLPSVGSDHNPLLMELVVRHENNGRYFKFLQCSIDNNSFMGTVKECCDRETTGDPMWVLH